MSSDVKVGVVHSSWLDGLRTMTDEEVKEFFQNVPERPGNIDDMKAEEPNLDGPYDQDLRAKFKEHERAKRAERGRAICEEALRTINGERQDQYGNPEDTFTRIAHLWTAYLSGDGDVIMIMPPMVADMMCLLKMAREAGGSGKKDNYVDMIGYAALGAAMRGYDA